MRQALGVHHCFREGNQVADCVTKLASTSNRALKFRVSNISLELLKVFSYQINGSCSPLGQSMTNLISSSVRCIFVFFGRTLAFLSIKSYLPFILVMVSSCCIDFEVRYSPLMHFFLNTS